MASDTLAALTILAVYAGTLLTYAYKEKSN